MMDTTLCHIVKSPAAPSVMSTMLRLVIEPSLLLWAVEPSLLWSMLLRVVARRHNLGLGFDEILLLSGTGACELEHECPYLGCL
jgi:hypothetical protein